MATTWASTTVLSSTLRAAGASWTDGASVQVDGNYAMDLYLWILNGATGPTAPGQFQIQVSPDDTDWYNLYGALEGNTTNLGQETWVRSIPVTTKYLRTRYGQNTVQSVTFEAVLVRIDKL